jgi:hypothetical protein
VDLAYISIGTLEFLIGDMDCDRDVDFDDIDDLVLGLNDPLAYEQLVGLPPSRKGDTDADGDLDFDDIAGFVEILNPHSVAANRLALAEPSCEGLLLMSALLLVPILRRRARAPTSSPLAGESFQADFLAPAKLN